MSNEHATRISCGLKNADAVKINGVTLNCNLHSNHEVWIKIGAFNCLLNDLREMRNMFYLL